MEDACSSPAAAPSAALPPPRYVLEPEWPHRAVPVDACHGKESTAAAASRPGLVYTGIPGA